MTQKAVFDLLRSHKLVLKKILRYLFPQLGEFSIRAIWLTMWSSLHARRKRSFPANTNRTICLHPPPTHTQTHAHFKKSLSIYHENWKIRTEKFNWRKLDPPWRKSRAKNTFWNKLRRSLPLFSCFSEIRQILPSFVVFTTWAESSEFSFVFFRASEQQNGP